MMQVEVESTSGWLGISQPDLPGMVILAMWPAWVCYRLVGGKVNREQLDISGLLVTNIKYVDRLTIDELIKQYPELSDLKLVQVDNIDNGEILSKIENESLDFIIANHFIEHARNLMGTIENWFFKLRPI
jgi:phage terminase large subunit-like protein